MHNDVKEILLNEEEIAEIVSRIAKEISEDYKGKKLLLVCVLKGSICFTADLMRKITIPLHIEFLRAKSYLAGSAESCGDVQVRSAIENLPEYDVVVVEDDHHLYESKDEQEVNSDLEYMRDCLIMIGAVRTGIRSSLREVYLEIY